MYPAARLGTLVCLMFLSSSPAHAADFVPQAQAEMVPESAKLELLWHEGEFTEGPAADADGSILFSDIGNRIYRFDPQTGATTIFRENSGKANGLAFDQQGRLIACEGANGGNRRISITERGKEPVALAETFAGKRFNSPNDVAVAPNGNVYFTDPRYVGDEPRELDFEGVFLIDRQGTEPAVHVATRSLDKPNGILISADGKTAFVADNDGAAQGHHHLTAFPIQADGTFGQKRILFDFGPDRRGIDGMCFDAQGNIFATAGRGSAAGVYVFAQDGKPLAFIPTPGAPTNCTFGLGDQRSTLYITAAGPQDSPKYALYRIRLE